MRNILKPKTITIDGVEYPLLYPTQSAVSAYDYPSLMIRGYQIIVIEHNYGEPDLSDIDGIRAAIASFHESDGKWVRLPCADSNESAPEFDMSLMTPDNTKAELYNQYGNYHLFVKSRAESKVDFKFVIFDQEIASKIWAMRKDAVSINMKEDYNFLQER